MEQEDSPSKQAIAFVRAGEEPGYPMRTAAGILASTWDWQLMGYHERQLKFSQHIVTTTLRPNMVLVTDSTKQVVPLELTILWEGHLEEAFERKLTKYDDLVRECQKIW